MRVYVDHTHVWRPVTGIERITLQLFSPAALSPLDVVPINAGRMKDMLLKQTFYLPACLARSPLDPGERARPLNGAGGSATLRCAHEWRNWHTHRV